MAKGLLGEIVGQADIRVNEGMWLLDDDDYALIAMLRDPVFCAELLFENPLNHEYGGCYTVLDYQVPLFRPKGCYQSFPCARSVGKTESIKARAVSHVFRRTGEDLLVTAPELIHLEPLTAAIEERITATRLTRDFLRKDSQKTGFTHKPFLATFTDGTQIVGRIPRLDGRGVKGMHEPDLMIDEAQDYPERGWIEVHERLALDTLVLTPLGFTRLADVAVGDSVVALDGSPTKVTGMSPVETREILIVHFSDGATVECDEDHEWTVAVPATISKGNWNARSTRQIEADLRKPGKACGSPSQPWHVPTPSPLEFDVDPDLTVDPYVLGLLIGDGCIRVNSLRFSTEDRELLDALRAELNEEEHLVDAGPSADWWVYRRARSTHERTPMLDKLDGLGLLGSRAHEKRVPSRYLWASVEDRLAMVQGLVDSDGHVNRSGAVVFVTTSVGLSLDFAWLVRSLGGRLTSRTTPNGMYRTTHIVYARLPDHLCPARLPRKAAAIYNGNTARLNRRIVKVERAGYSKPTRCLEVEHPSHMFMTGWALVPSRNTVMKDHVDSTGNYDFTYHFYGVHAGSRGGKFHELSSSGNYTVTAITAVMKPGWNKREKQAAAAMYGGTTSPDYRRNVLGEPGTSLSAFFVMSRLMACVDQDSDSKYNTVTFKAQELQAEEVDKMIPAGGDVGTLLDLPQGLGQQVYCGMDIGLVTDPTVIMLFAVIAGELKLIRMIHLWRFREKQIRQITYQIARMYGKTLRAFGQDITGLGLPLYQAMEDDEECPEHLKEVARGYVFNAKMPVAVDPNYVSKEGDRLVDQYGHLVEVVRDKWTGRETLVAKMTMIEASTRYLRKFVDDGFLRIPFLPPLVGDMQGETEQRVRAMAGMKKKPNAFHMLDAMRAMAMAYMAASVEEQVYAQQPTAVMDRAVTVPAY